MSTVVGRSGRESGYKVYFVTLSRRWWRGAVLGVLIVLGSALAVWLDRSRDDGALDVAVGHPFPAVETAASVEPPVVAATAVRSHPFDGLRLERERQRSRQAELLQATAEDPSVSESRRRQAHEELLALWALEARELEIEHFLHAQGYDGVVMLGAASAHVVVEGILDVHAAALIGELTHRVSGVRREAITIVDGITSGR